MSGCLGKARRHSPELLLHRVLLKGVGLGGFAAGPVLSRVWSGASLCFQIPARTP